MLHRKTLICDHVQTSFFNIKSLITLPMHPYKILDVIYLLDTVPLWRPALELNGLPCVNKV